jgi:pimeloyl-ACP methyl ester carboxylesterase
MRFLRLFFVLIGMGFVLFFVRCENSLNLNRNDTTKTERKAVVSKTGKYLEVDVRINGELMNYSYQPAVLNTDLNRVLVPLNETMSRCGFSVSWNGDTREATCVKGDNKLVFKQDSRKVIVTNDEEENAVHYLGAPVIIMPSSNRMMVPIHALSDYTKVTSAFWDRKTLTVNVIYWDELYCGITWIGKGGSWYYNFQKQKNPLENPYYDPEKPTVLYVHGWQNGAVNKQYFPDLHLTYDGADRWTQNTWIEEGWNVGIFHWPQLADGINLLSIEAKMWNANNGYKGMEWRTSDGSYEKQNTPNRSVGQILYQEYLAALQYHDPGKEIRVVGHSLGNQLVTRLAKDLIDNYGENHPLVPDRVTLLDPAYTALSQDYLAPHNNGASCSTADICADYGEIIADAGVPIMFRRSSGLMFIPGTDYNYRYQEIAAFAELKPWYTDAHEWGAKHSVPTKIYFWSKAFPMIDHPNANTPGDVILDMMGPQNYSKEKWVQKGGKETLTPADDTFEKEDFYPM